MPKTFLTNELIKKDIRPSYQRVKVLEYLHQHSAHPTVDEIYHHLTPEIPSLSKTTIYNTLRVFINAGLVRTVTIDDGELRYDLNRTDHGHFKCEACGVIIDFPIDIEQIPYEGLSHFLIKERNVYFKGLCPDCLTQTVQENK